MRALEAAFPGLRLLEMRALPKQGIAGPLDEEPPEDDMHDEDAPILDIFDLETDDD